MVAVPVDKKDLEVIPSIYAGMQQMKLIHHPSGLVGFGSDTYSSRKAYSQAVEDLKKQMPNRLNFLR